MSADDQAEEINPLTLMPAEAPLPQAGSWALATPRPVMEYVKAARLAQERLRAGVHLRDGEDGDAPG